MPSEDIYTHIPSCAKDCNSRLGEAADAKLAEDLSFYTDMLCVKKNRQNRHCQIMTNEDGQDIVVEGAGKKLTVKVSIC